VFRIGVRENEVIVHEKKRIVETTYWTEPQFLAGVRPRTHFPRTTKQVNSKMSFRGLKHNFIDKIYL
jgi:hypothetical protein